MKADDKSVPEVFVPMSGMLYRDNNNIINNDKNSAECPEKKLPSKKQTTTKSTYEALLLV